MAPIAAWFSAREHLERAARADCPRSLKARPAGRGACEVGGSPSSRRRRTRIRRRPREEPWRHSGRGEGRQKIIMKTEAARHTLAAPPTPCACTAAAMNGHGRACRPADQYRISTEKRSYRSRHDRGEQAELRRQAHQLGQGQPVRERDQGGDKPPVASPASPRQPYT